MSYDPFASWNDTVKSINNGEKLNNYYGRVIRNMADGLNLATPEMTKAYTPNLPGVEGEAGEMFYVLEACASSAPEGKQIGPAVVMENHERSNPIDVIVQILTDKYRGKQAWLMPVADNQEYVSWTFVIIEGKEEEILSKIEEFRKEAAKFAETQWSK